ncbi:MAG: YggS family pyridoxal phosphate-dependent enzyme [Chitinophagaceae bacterium]|nr:YggS family pyridoxal phosphate-dependent enzyme [Chitinophagaceae bacterium]
MNHITVAIDRPAYQRIKQELDERNALLVAVSKTKPIADIQALYDLGHRDFGENYVQEMVAKQKQLPPDIHWHFIGHLQRNKVKEIAPFVHLIQSVDSLKLLSEIHKQAVKYSRTIAVLLQVHIAREETKFGLDEEELKEIMYSHSGFPNVEIKGLMGMASLTADRNVIREEFHRLRVLYDQFSGAGQYPLFSALSMGMSSDYLIALNEGATMVRIGSLLFGARERQ